MTASSRVALIRKLLEAQLEPEHLVVRDDSDLHQGHAGARDGAGHYTIWITSARFAAQRPLQRHRLVYAALASLMPGQIHALSIHAELPPSKSLGSTGKQEET